MKLSPETYKVPGDSSALVPHDLLLPYIVHPVPEVYFIDNKGRVTASPQQQAPISILSAGVFRPTVIDKGWPIESIGAP